MERAIGAGSYRDAEPPASVENALGSGIAGLWSESDDDTSSSNGNQFEGSLQKKARETGEWLAHKTETEFRISEKQGLEFLFKWALPISLLAMMVAVGVVKLPFLSPFLDDFIL
ncbi:Probable NAD(P)H dehydrogenase subunit CRR3, chloroplastic [Linum grandiflorum]